MLQQELEKRRPVILELGFDQSKWSLLESYLELLLQSNEEMNLISRQMTVSELVDNHVIDCLLPLTSFPAEKVKTAADFGSGGGLPSVIYSIQFPKIKFKLFEKSPKKQSFLNKVQQTLSLNLEVHSIIPNDFSDVDLVTARAFKPIDVILDLSRKYYLDQGKYFLLKGRQEKIQEELVLAKKKFKSLELRTVPLKSPVLEVERNLVLIN